MTTTFALLCARCGLSMPAAAAYLAVRPDTAKSWSSGRTRTPDGVIGELRALYARIERAADEAVRMARRQRVAPGTVIEIGIAADDHEARALGWPCVGAQAAALGIAAARLPQPVRIVPRGSTLATAGAADAHGR